MEQSRLISSKYNFYELFEERERIYEYCYYCKFSRFYHCYEIFDRNYGYSNYNDGYLSLIPCRSCRLNDKFEKYDKDKYNKYEKFLRLYYIKEHVLKMDFPSMNFYNSNLCYWRNHPKYFKKCERVLSVSSKYIEDKKFLNNIFYDDEPSDTYKEKIRKLKCNILSHCQKFLIDINSYDVYNIFW